jgi:stage V sporulation protein B
MQAFKCVKTEYRFAARGIDGIGEFGDLAWEKNPIAICAVGVCGGMEFSMDDVARRNNKSFLSGAAILGAAGLMVQILGAVFRIPLANIIGEVGMGYFQTAYPVYIFLLVFSTNGAPAAISKMISERVAARHFGEAQRVFKLSFIVMLIFGLAAFLCVAFLAKPLSIFVKSEGSYLSLLAISPALLFVPIMSVFRGYFQGLQEMRPTAVSQLAEQAVRVIIGLLLAGIFVSNSLELASAGACLAASIGPVIGLFVLIIVYLIFGGQLKTRQDDRSSERVSRDRPVERAVEAKTSPKDYRKESAGGILKTLAILTIPTTIGISILPIMNVVDMLICRLRLIDSGLSALEAERLYGLMSGFAAPIINIPMALALSIGLSLIPAIAAASSTHDTEFLNKNITMGLRTAVIIGVPCSFGLMTLAAPVMRLIYPVFREGAGSASSYLMILAAGVIFLCIAQTMAGVLQGLGRVALPVFSLLVGVLVKAALTYVLTAIPTLNINGATVGSFVGFVVIGLMNLMYVVRVTGVKFDLVLSALKPLVSGAIMSVLVALIYFLCHLRTGESLGTLMSICIGAGAYGIMIIKSKAILPEEIATLPKGMKIVKFLKKVKLV